MAMVFECHWPLVQCIYCCTVIMEAFRFQHHLAGFCCINISLAAKGTRGGKAAWASFTVNTLSEKPYIYTIDRNDWIWQMFTFTLGRTLFLAQKSITSWVSLIPPANSSFTFTRSYPLSCSFISLCRKRYDETFPDPLPRYFHLAPSQAR
jgi:hypothetical protein